MAASNVTQSPMFTKSAVAAENTHPMSVTDGPLCMTAELEVCPFACVKLLKSHKLPSARRLATTQHLTLQSASRSTSVVKDGLRSDTQT